MSVEQGPIARLIDLDHDGRFDERKVIASQVRNCQGLAFIRGRLFAVGNGPQGAGIYRLSEPDKDGAFQKCELERRAARGGMGEHGPHAITLGPDGALYYNNGNHAHLNPPIEPASPVYIPYEGELLPHFDDACGHAAGIICLGGEILRSDDDGKRRGNGWSPGFATSTTLRSIPRASFSLSTATWSGTSASLGIGRSGSIIARSARNSAGGTARGSGRLTISTASASGLRRRRPRQPHGGDVLPGKPVPGQISRQLLLICDWSQWRILAVFFKRAGASYQDESTHLVTGAPLNCTDIEVGPEGSVYFTTGGRGTQGGLYRVSWAGGASPAGEGPGRASGPGSGASEGLEILNAPHMPSPLASFTQHRIDQIRKAKPEVWGQLLETMVRRHADSATRVRAQV